MPPDDLIDAARRGDLNALRAALRAGVDVNAPGAVAGTALDAACTAGHLAAARLLLQHGATISPETWNTVSLKPDPACVFLLETADLGLPLPAWLEAAIAKEEARADLPALLAALAGGNANARRQAADRVFAAVQGGVPVPPVMAALERTADDTDPQVSRSVAGLLERLAKAGHVVKIELHARVLAHALAQSPEEAALLAEALAAGRQRGTASLNELVWRLRAEPPVDAHGSGARVAGFALAQDTLAQQPVDWSAVDRLAGHALPGAREGALEAVGRAWARLDAGTDRAAWERRLLMGLADESASVRGQAAARLDEAWQEQALAPSIPDAVLSVLVDRLRAEQSRAIAFTLSHAVETDAAAAARVLALLDGVGEEGPAGELLRLCREVVEGRRPPLCAACGALGPEETWGESIGGPDEPPPPAFKRLQLSMTWSDTHDLYRCPACGSYFERRKHEETFLAGSSTWDSYSLTRREPLGELELVEAARKGDWAAVARALLDPASDEVRLRGLAALGRQASEGLDVSALEPALRELAHSAPPPIRKAAASVLALHQLRIHRIADAVALLESHDEAQEVAALNALDEGAGKGWPAAPICAGRARATLWALAGDASRDVRLAAVRAICTAGLADSVPGTIAAATDALDSDRPWARESAARVLAAAADNGHDVGASLPRLAALLLDADAGRAALDALGKAHLKGADVAPFVPALAEYLRARPRASDTLDVTHILHALQERGVDLAPAFEPLAIVGGDWPMEVLQKAVEHGRDIAAAVATLQRMAIDDHTSLGRVAVEILARHFARAGDWTRLEPLVKHPDPERAEAARTAVEQAARGGQATHEALQFLGRLTSGAAPTDPGRTSWILGRDHVEVNEREVVRWRDSPFGGAGQSCDLQEFLAGTMQVDVAGTFGARVLGEVVEAARRLAQPKKRAPRVPRKPGGSPVPERAAAPRDPGRTSWSKGRDHVEVNEREVLRWTDSPFGGDGQSCGLQEFLAGTMQVDVAGTFGARVLREAVEAARRLAQPKKRARKPPRKPKA